MMELNQNNHVVLGGQAWHCLGHRKNDAHLFPVLTLLGKDPTR
jgi:hypothetical protein